MSAPGRERRALVVLAFLLVLPGPAGADPPRYLGAGEASTFTTDDPRGGVLFLDTLERSAVVVLLDGNPTTIDARGFAVPVHTSTVTVRPQRPVYVDWVGATGFREATGDTLAVYCGRGGGSVLWTLEGEAAFVESRGGKGPGAALYGNDPREVVIGGNVAQRAPLAAGTVRMWVTYVDAAECTGATTFDLVPADPPPVLGPQVLQAALLALVAVGALLWVGRRQGRGKPAAPAPPVDEARL